MQCLVKCPGSLQAMICVEWWGYNSGLSRKYIIIPSDLKERQGFLRQGCVAAMTYFPSRLILQPQATSIDYEGNSLGPSFRCGGACNSDGGHQFFCAQFSSFCAS